MMKKNYNVDDDDKAINCKDTRKNREANLTISLRGAHTRHRFSAVGSLTRGLCSAMHRWTSRAQRAHQCQGSLLFFGDIARAYVDSVVRRTRLIRGCNARRTAAAGCTSPYKVFAPAISH